MDAHSIQDVRALIGPTPPDGHRRDALLGHLHLLNDRYGALFERHLLALASEMGLAVVEVHEVATFYHHFEVVRDDQVPAALKVRVCDGQSCAMAGSRDLLDRMPASLASSVQVVAAPCLGRCEQAPAVLVGQRALASADLAAVHQSLQEIANRKTKQPVETAEYAWTAPDLIAYQAYREAGGYALAAAIVNGEEAADDVIRTIDDAGLRGLGGAGFAAGRKWRIVRAQAAPRLMAVNIDEGEPGTFKDRTYLERDPHRFLEGMLVAAQVTGTEACYIYLRDEYHDLRRLLAARDRIPAGRSAVPVAAHRVAPRRRCLRLR